VDDELYDLLASNVADLGLELVDVQSHAGLVRVVVDRPGGADLDLIADATRAVSALLDRHDPQPGHRYTLEVSSPGIERPLRTFEQFSRAVGEAVTVRTTSGGEGERRVRGTLVAADPDGFVVEGEGLPEGGRRLSYDDVDRARTVFEWPRTSRPSRPKRTKSSERPQRRTGRGAESGKVATP
jgi:ribosome maturation factor RimP